jgi:hypothetical protein
VSESGPSASPFSAPGPALGYLAQVDYALLAALERMDDEDDFAVSIETLDDIVFHDPDSGDATEKWQSKRVANAGPSAALLRTGGDRDVPGAEKRLERTAQTSANKANADYYAAFLALSEEQRRALLDRVEIFDGVLRVAEVQSLLERP